MRINIWSRSDVKGNLILGVKINIEVQEIMGRSPFESLTHFGDKKKYFEPVCLLTREGMEDEKKGKESQGEEAYLLLTHSIL